MAFCEVLRDASHCALISEFAESFQKVSSCSHGRGMWVDVQGAASSSVTHVEVTMWSWWTRWCNHHVTDRFPLLCQEERNVCKSCICPLCNSALRELFYPSFDNSETVLCVRGPALFHPTSRNSEPLFVFIGQGDMSPSLRCHRRLLCPEAKHLGQYASAAIDTPQCPLFFLLLGPLLPVLFFPPARTPSH